MVLTRQLFCMHVFVCAQAGAAAPDAAEGEGEKKEEKLTFLTAQ